MKWLHISLLNFKTMHPAGRFCSTAVTGREIFRAKIWINLLTSYETPPNKSRTSANFFRRSRPTVSEKVQRCTRLLMELIGYHSNLNPSQFSTMNRRQQKAGARREALFIHWSWFKGSPIRVCSTGTSGGAGMSRSIWNLAIVFLSEKWLSETYLS
jgi:hypothetical protein